jgi:acyl-CoA reductase-like NAD-dependent aldehyde dehydrogenase
LSRFAANLIPPTGVSGVGRQVAPHCLRICGSRPRCAASRESALAAPLTSTSSAANWAALGILYNTGQDCTAGSRLYVQDTIYDKFVEILKVKASELVIGDGFDEKSGGGPLVRRVHALASGRGSLRVQVSEGQYDRVWGFIEAGKKEGAKCILGGEKRSTPGWFVDPTSECSPK